MAKRDKKVSRIGKAQEERGAEVRIEILDKRATYLEVRDLGRLPTLREFIRALKDNPAFHHRSQGSWYWLGEAGLHGMGYHRIDYEKGEITPVSDHDFYQLPFEQRAYVSGGDGRPALFVFGDYDDGRLAVNAFSDPRFSARVALVQPSEARALEPPSGPDPALRRLDVHRPP